MYIHTHTHTHIHIYIYVVNMMSVMQKILLINTHIPSFMTLGLVAKACPTLATPWTIAHQALLCPWDSPGKNTGVGCHFLLQGIFLTQESYLGLLHGRWMIYQLSYEGSPHMTLTGD